MRNVIILLASIVFIVSCNKGNTTTPGPDYVPFNTYVPDWKSMVLVGKDSTDVITSVGIDKTDSFFGRFIYKNDTFSISKSEIVNSTKTIQLGYSWGVELHKLDGSGWDWKATLGKYQYGTRIYYLLTMNTVTTYFNKTYVDSM